jgi:hypothetical protein
MKHLINAKRKKLRDEFKKSGKPVKAQKTEPQKQLAKAKAEARKLAAERTAAAFSAACERHGIPIPVPEFKFAQKDGPHKGRLWAIDYYFDHNGKKLGLEVEGGIYGIGRHQRPTGFRKDMEKYNAFVLYGITLYRREPGTLMADDTFRFLKDFFNEK